MAGKTAKGGSKGQNAGGRAAGGAPAPADGAGTSGPVRGQEARRARDRAILVAAGVILVLLFLVGLAAPSLISMKSTAAAVAGFVLLGACLTGVALLVDRLLERFF